MAKKLTATRAPAKSRPAARRRPPTAATPVFLDVRLNPAIVFTNIPDDTQTIAFRVAGFSTPLTNAKLEDPGDATAVFTITKTALSTDFFGQVLEVSFTYRSSGESVIGSGRLLITIESGGIPARKEYRRIAYVALLKPPKPKRGGRA